MSESLKAKLQKGNLGDKKFVEILSFLVKNTSSEAVISVPIDQKLYEKLDAESFLNYIKTEFEEKHLQSFGFVLKQKPIQIQGINMRSIVSRDDIDLFVEKCGSVPEDYSTFTKVSENSIDTNVDLLFEVDKEGSQDEKECKFFKSTIYKFENIESRSYLEGPALVVMKGSCIVVEPYWKCFIDKNKNFVLEWTKEDKMDDGDILENLANQVDSGSKIIKDPVMLSIMGQRFMSIAEQMGRILQRTSVSTNIKERLDFSCAIFDPDGELVANAPHLPVHLGSMQSTVEYQIGVVGDKWKPGDVYISNHPKAGGSHLPDITAISACF